jgi:hypothetical protein
VRFLTGVFSIEVCAYAIMYNHYHLVLFVNETELADCSDSEICERWDKLYTVPSLISRWKKGELSSDIQKEEALKIIAEWRERLSSISWFMRCLNEFIACKANKEDKCKGRFWEDRLKSQALLDEKALLTCMAYVDLNPIRAQMAPSAEESEYTSVFEWIHEKAHHNEAPDNTNSKALVKGMSINANHRGLTSH